MKITKRCCRGTARRCRLAKRATHLEVGGVYGALKEYCADGDVVRPVKPVDGTPIFVGERRRGARVMQEWRSQSDLQRLERQKNEEDGSNFDVGRFVKSTDGSIAGKSGYFRPPLA